MLFEDELSRDEFLEGLSVAYYAFVKIYGDYPNRQSGDLAEKAMLHTLRNVNEVLEYEVFTFSEIRNRYEYNCLMASEGMLAKHANGIYMVFVSELLTDAEQSIFMKKVGMIPVCFIDMNLHDVVEAASRGDLELGDC